MGGLELRKNFSGEKKEESKPLQERAEREGKFKYKERPVVPFTQEKRGKKKVLSPKKKKYKSRPHRRKGGKKKGIFYPLRGKKRKKTYEEPPFYRWKGGKFTLEEEKGEIGRRRLPPSEKTRPSSFRRKGTRKIRSTLPK